MSQEVDSFTAAELRLAELFDQADRMSEDSKALDSFLDSLNEEDRAEVVSALACANALRMAGSESPLSYDRSGMETDTNRPGIQNPKLDCRRLGIYLTKTRNRSQELGEIARIELGSRRVRPAHPKAKQSNIPRKGKTFCRPLGLWPYNYGSVGHSNCNR